MSMNNLEPRQTEQEELEQPGRVLWVKGREAGAWEELGVVWKGLGWMGSIVGWVGRDVLNDVGFGNGVE